MQNQFASLNIMKIIVTGGAGFIASHVTDAYIRAGHTVAVIDNLSTGFRKNVNPKAKFYKADIRNLARMEEIFMRERPEIVSHHAARINIAESVKNPLPTLDTNLTGTLHVLIAFGKYGSGAQRKCIYASSAAVYGNPKKIPVEETAETNPLSTYGFSKLLGEEMVRFYASHFGFEYIIFRYTNVYGPRQAKGSGVVPIFFERMKSGKQPVIFGNGENKRDYLYISDIVRGNRLALRNGKNETVNLGRGVSLTDRETFSEIAKTVRFKKPPRYAPVRPGEIGVMALSAKKAERILGWRPKISFEKGISLVAR